jgi:hypothetical protein
MPQNLKYHQLVAVAILIVLALSLASCSPDASNEPAVSITDTVTVAPEPSNEPRIFFTNIEDGDTVSSPVSLKWSSENFTIEPYGDVDQGPIVREGAGHLHIIIDAPCIAAGETIRNPSDGSQIHYLLGQTETELALTPGEHRLCLQAGDGAHTALPGDSMRQVISIHVEE